MNRACKHCGGQNIKASNSPIYGTPYEDLSGQERVRLAKITNNFWTEPLNPPVSLAQQRVANERVVRTLAPWYIDNGGSTRDASVTQFYT